MSTSSASCTACATKSSARGAPTNSLPRAGTSTNRRTPATSRDGRCRLSSSPSEAPSVGTPRVVEHGRIDDVDRRPGRIRDDLIEDVRELYFVLVARHVADVRRGDDVAQREQ